MKRKREDFEKDLEMVKEINKEMKSGITMKGALVSYALLNGGKNIENRTKKIKPGWYALHTGSSKIDLSIEKYVIKNLKTTMDENKIPKETDLPHSCIVGAFHISGAAELKDNKDLQNNGWSLGPICNFVDKTLAFENPVPTKGAITLGWSFDSVDKWNKIKEKLSERIKKELEEKRKKIIEKIKELNHSVEKIK